MLPFAYVGPIHSYPPRQPSAMDDLMAMSAELRECGIATLQLAAVYPARGEPYVCHGNTVYEDGEIEPWHAMNDGRELVKSIAAAVLRFMPNPPTGSFPRRGELVWIVEIRGDGHLGLSVDSLVEHRPGPPEMPPFSGPVS